MRLREGGLLRVDPYDSLSGYDSIIDKEDALLLNEQEPVFPLELLDHLLAAKAKYPNAFLYSISGYHILYRLLYRYEYEAYVSIKNCNGDSIELKKAIVNKAILGIYTGDTVLRNLDDLNLDKVKAYTIQSICDIVLNLSNFDDPSYIQDLQDLNTKHLKEGYLDSILDWHIKSNLNNITSEDLARMNIAEYGELLGAIAYYSKGESRLSISQESDKKV